MIQLAVNIDHVATIREARGGIEPDPVAAASIAELSGAVGIVCHLREDRRHVNDRDVRLLRETVKTKLDLEMGAHREIVDIAIETLPELVTLVPEKREERTTEGGLDVAGNLNFFTELVEEFHEHEIAVSFFVEPDENQVLAVKKTGAEIIELHTGTYANAFSKVAHQRELDRLRIAAKIAHDAGLKVTGGHGLNYVNVREICEIEYFEELSIGHAIMSRAIFSGLERAVRDMVDILHTYSRRT